MYIKQKYVSSKLNKIAQQQPIKKLLEEKLNNTAVRENTATITDITQVQVHHMFTNVPLTEALFTVNERARKKINMLKSTQ
jgi:hypothetical protein